MRDVQELIREARRQGVVLVRMPEPGRIDVPVKVIDLALSALVDSLHNLTDISNQIDFDTLDPNIASEFGSSVVTMRLAISELRKEGAKRIGNHHHLTDWFIFGSQAQAELVEEEFRGRWEKVDKVREEGLGIPLKGKLIPKVSIEEGQ